MPDPTPTPQPDGEPNIHTLDRRLTNIERVVIQIQAAQSPKWLRVTALGVFVGAVVKKAFLE